MKKLILTDLDHTLLRTDGNVSDRTLDVLKSAEKKDPLLQ
ncbi:HAD hydrolase family protein [Ruminococcus flavefaciens]|uniref:Haloacid dehalogenase-like hydrolase n=1 Tax=Ruminococcus flavefaciens TaxID=1265 RepID=A0A1M7LZX3_RUMFL|nr:HAD hydrolase family protein [Ruminococcus flavefaciens]SHM83970.1 haloacid dehalogenase-like hydrolase [Ruminococcus flavefaciens]